MPKTIISLFDYMGTWSRPYKDADYEVIKVDIRTGQDIMYWQIPNKPIHGILAAPPCTDFSVSGSSHWARQDADGTTKQSVRLVIRTLAIIEQCKPSFFALENPVGRLNSLIPELQSLGPWYFQPHWFGDPYTKKTGLWGRFNSRLKWNYVKPIMYKSAGKQSSWMYQCLGGKSMDTKEQRSMTPVGFAKAFMEANP